MKPFGTLSLLAGLCATSLLQPAKARADQPAGWAIIFTEEDQRIVDGIQAVINQRDALSQRVIYSGKDADIRNIELASDSQFSDVKIKAIKANKNIKKINPRPGTNKVAMLQGVIEGRFLYHYGSVNAYCEKQVEHSPWGWQTPRLYLPPICLIFQAWGRRMPATEEVQKPGSPPEPKPPTPTTPVRTRSYPASLFS